MNNIDRNTNNGTTDGTGTVNVNNTSSNSNTNIGTSERVIKLCGCVIAIPR